MLTAQTPNNEWSVAGYLAHLAVSKKWWGKHINEEQVSHIPSLFSKTEEGLIASKDLAQIKDVFEQTSKVILETVANATDKGKLPYPSIDVYLIQQMIHDGHHRGQILLTLRNAGYTPPMMMISGEAGGRISRNLNFQKDLFKVICYSLQEHWSVQNS